MLTISTCIISLWRFLKLRVPHGIVRVAKGNGSRQQSGITQLAAQDNARPVHRALCLQSPMIRPRINRHCMALMALTISNQSAGLIAVKNLVTLGGKPIFL